MLNGLHEGFPLPLWVGYMPLEAEPMLNLLVGCICWHSGVGRL